jgi:hypothetical protein
VARGQKPCSAKTGAYCQARERAREVLFHFGLLGRSCAR